MHPPGVGRCLVQAQTFGLRNLKVFSEDALAVLACAIPDASLDKVLLYFLIPGLKQSIISAVLCRATCYFSRTKTKAWRLFSYGHGLASLC